MRTWIACAGAVALLAACGTSKDAEAAWAAMNIGDGTSGMVRYQSKSGSGDTITLNNVTLGGPGDALVAASLTFRGLDVTEAGQPYFTGVALRDIKPEQSVPGLDLSLSSITVEGLNRPVGVFMASAFSEAGPGDPPPFPEWEMGKFAINGLTVKGDLAQMGLGGGKLNVAMKELSVSNLKDTVFGAAKFDGLKGDFDIPAEAGAGFPIVGKFDFGTADVRGIRGGVFASAFEAGFNAAMDPSAMATLNADIMAAMGSPLEAGYDSVNWSPMSFEASGAKIAISRIEQKISRNADGVAIASSSPRTSITFTSDSSGGMLGQMSGMFLSMAGYTKIELYGGGEATYDPATDLMRYVNYNFGLTDGFDISMKGGFLGFMDAMTAFMSAMDSMTTGMDPFDPYGGSMAEPDMSGFAAFKIVDLDITLTDKSFVDKLLALAPLMGGGDPETMRNDIVSMLSFAGPDFAAAGLDPALSNELMTAVADFIRNPGTLNIKLAPAQPVAILEENANYSKAQLGFSATHTPGR